MSIDTSKTITAVTYNGVSIPLAGGGPSGSGDYVVTFIDYNGDIISQVRGNTGDHITLPNSPSHTDLGLTFAGWTSPIESMSTIANNNYITVGKADLYVAAAYTGNTLIEVEFPDYYSTQQASFNLSFMGSTSSELPESIDWGDGSVDPAINISSNMYHTYDTTTNKKFIIKISSTSNIYGLRAAGTMSFENTVIKGVFVGGNVNKISYYDETMVTYGGINYNNWALKYVSYANNLYSTYVITQYEYTGCERLETLIIPDGASFITGGSTFSGMALGMGLASLYKIAFSAPCMLYISDSGSGEGIGQFQLPTKSFTYPRDTELLSAGSTSNRPYGLIRFYAPIIDLSNTHITTLPCGFLGEAGTENKFKFPSSIQTIYGAMNGRYERNITLLDFSDLVNMPSFTPSTYYEYGPTGQQEVTANTVLYPYSSYYGSASGQDMINPELKVVVPDSLYSQFIDTTTHPEWSNVVQNIIRASDYTD